MNPERVPTALICALGARGATWEMGHGAQNSARKCFVSGEAIRNLGHGVPCSPFCHRLLGLRGEEARLDLQLGHPQTDLFIRSLELPRLEVQETGKRLRMEFVADVVKIE
jgi:hypothetical protein